jgi:thymidylate synthase (FAD)
MHTAKLVSVTHGAEEHAVKNAQEIVMYCARASNPVEQDSGKIGLIKYCIKNKHWSIFEMANMVVEISTSRAISPQILRHRSFSFQEFSQRYADITLLGGSLPLPNLRRQDKKNRQASYDDLDADTIKIFESRIDNLYAIAIELYNNMLSHDIAKECAREVLPIGTPTKLYMNGSLRSWITYIALREKNGTQSEHQKIAKSCKQIFCLQFPAIAEALGGFDHDWEI